MKTTNTDRLDANLRQPSPAHAQRLRVIFSQQGVLRYVGHLDVVRTWERALRRAGIPLAYSEGFNPQPRVFFAAALPLGATGQREVADIILTERMEPDTFAAQVNPHLPAGLAVISACEAPLKTPALQSRMSASEWLVDVHMEGEPVAIADRIASFLAEETVASSRKRKGRAVAYDLRRLVLGLNDEGPVEPGWQRVAMRLRSEPNATGRPDAVLKALGLDDRVVRMDRTACIFADEASA